MGALRVYVIFWFVLCASSDTGGNPNSSDDYSYAIDEEVEYYGKSEEVEHQEFGETSSDVLMINVRGTSGEDSCFEHDFACGSGECVSINVVCDGDNNCPDGSDEHNCHTESMNTTVLTTEGIDANTKNRSDTDERDDRCPCEPTSVKDSVPQECQLSDILECIQSFFRWTADQLSSSAHFRCFTFVVVAISVASTIAGIYLIKRCVFNRKNGSNYGIKVIPFFELCNCGTWILCHVYSTWEDGRDVPL